MLLTPEQLFEIQKIIEEHHQAFAANAFGQDAVPPEVLRKLKEKGLIKESVDSISESYTYGQLIGVLENQKVADMSYLEFKDYMSDNPIPLSPIERGAMAMAAASAGQYCRGLGNRVDVATGAILIEADQQLRARMEADIRTATEENIARRETVEQLKTDLGWATRDWSRDMKRIAVTEKVTAMNHGTANHFKKQHGADVLVAKRAMPDACKHCQRLYNGPNGPRVFKLSTLEANGTNVGKKTADWLAIVGATHPNCQCILIRIPKGWGFDEHGDLVPGGEIDLYETPDDLAASLMEEMELQKAFKLQGHVTYQGIPIAIENKEGSVRKWTDVNGATGETKMVGVNYGYVKGTMGADEDEIDVFVGPDPRAKLVYVIEQQNPDTGTYDEQKCMLGFPNQKTAERAYMLHYDDPDTFIITVEPMEVEHFKRWVSTTKPKKGEMAKSSKDDLSKSNQNHLEDKLKLVVLIPERLEKAAARGGKYIRRVPYTDKTGKRKYRYYYSQSAAARDVQAGETIKLGKQYAEVKKIDKNGTIHLEVGKTTIRVAPKQWDNLLATHYGDAYFKWAEKRAAQSVNAVLRHVPKEELVDLKGSTDKERLEDLKTRVPKVYDKLQKSFQRAGVNPFRAKQVLTASLERRGWEPEARAAVIGNVITKRDENYRTTIRAAENLAGGARVKVGHVGAVTEIVEQAKNPEKDSIAEVAAQAEKELAKLSSLLAKAKSGNREDAGEALAAALSSKAIQQLNMISKAFPGIQDKAVEPAREAMLEAPSVAPTKPKSDGSSTTVFVAGEGGQPKGLNARYKLVEADDAIASHDPRSFNQRKDYPEGVQERAYHRDKSEQAKVQRNAQRLRPEFVINTNPDAVNGAPIMGPDGVVLGGNSRTMSMQLAYARHPEKAKELRSYMLEHAHEVGFSKEDVEQFKNPILVRVVEDGGKTKEDKQLLVRQMNESFTQGMDPRTMQVAMGRKLTDETLEELGKAMKPDETLNAFLATKRAEPFINSLQKVGIIDQRNANQYFLKNTKKLNPDGRTLVARILVGRTVEDADLLSATKPSLIENIARSVPYMAQAKSYGKGYDLKDDIRTALDAYNSLQYRVDTGSIPALNADMTAHRFDNLFGQQEMFGGQHPVTENPRAMGLLEVLIRKPGPNQITKVFKDYARQAELNPEGQASIFGAKESPTDIFQKVVKENLPKPPEEKQAGLFGKSEFIVPEGMDKSWGYFVGPRGGKWKDAAHTIPWEEPEKEKGRKKLGKPGPDTDDVKPLPGQIDIYEHVYGKSFEGLSGIELFSKGIPNTIGARTSPQGNRAPGPGLGVNYVIPMPKKNPGHTPGDRELPGKDEIFGSKEGKSKHSLYTTKEEYEFMEQNRRKFPLETPQVYIEANEDARVGTEERGKYVKEENLRNAPRPKNKAKIEPTEEEDDE